MPGLVLTLSYGSCVLADFFWEWKFLNQENLTDFTIKSPHSSWQEVTNISRIEEKGNKEME